MAEWVNNKARLAQSVERLALNQVVVGSSPTVGAYFLSILIFVHQLLSFNVLSDF